MAKQSNTGKIAAGVGLTTLAAAAAATYYFKGPGGKKHQKEVVAIAKKAKTEMLSKIKQMKSVSKKTYDQAASQVMAKYKQAKNIDPKHIAAIGTELKGHWSAISKTLNKARKSAVKSVSKKAPAKKRA